VHSGPDEVDRLVAAWQRERPDLDVEPLTVFSRISRLARHLALARRAAFAEHGLEGFEFDVLAALRRAGPPYEGSPGRLLTETLVGSGTMTHRLDRLEERGLVRRRPDPQDGRSVRVRLTARGRARVDAAFADLLDRERALLASLTPRQRTALAGLLRTLTAPFDAPAAPGSDAPAAPGLGAGSDAGSDG
jgi:DNA-binding MarR family transcriptional regulator